MNKIFYTLLLGCLFVLLSCNTATVEHVSTGVQNITKCCKSIRKITTCSNIRLEKAESNKTEDFELRAVYAWDTKMVLW